MQGRTRRSAALIGTPAAGTEDFRLWSEWLGRRLAEEGPAGIEAHLAQYTATAQHHAIDPADTCVLADRSAPDIVRARVFFRVAVALDAMDVVAA